MITEPTEKVAVDINAAVAHEFKVNVLLSGKKQKYVVEDLIREYNEKKKQQKEPKVIRRVKK